MLSQFNNLWMPKLDDSQKKRCRKMQFGRAPGVATPMQNLAMGALWNQHASQCLKIVWLGLLVLTPNISLCRFTLVVLHYLLMYTQPLFRVLRTALSSHWERWLPSEFFLVLIRCVTFQVTAVVMGSWAKVKCQL